jgi:hypothetical protein
MCSAASTRASRIAEACCWHLRARHVLRILHSIVPEANILDTSNGEQLVDAVVSRMSLQCHVIPGVQLIALASQLAIITRLNMRVS